jgi:hypothetical protein
MFTRKLTRFWLLSVLTVAPTNWAAAVGPAGQTRPARHRPLIAQAASKARPPARRRGTAAPLPNTTAAPLPNSIAAPLANGAAADSTPGTDLSATPATTVSTPAVVASTPATPVAATTQVGAASVAPFTPLAAPPMTLWRFLGIPQGASRLGGAALNRRGNLPGLEPKPPLKALADPANLVSDSKMLKKAGLIKQQEDLKKQKIKALKYLATIGCGCYNRNPKEPTVQEAFIEGLKDCTEEVRYQAAKQLANAAESKCEYCSKNCCCDANVMQVLSDIAVGRDENGCFNEPSARVREAACEALMACRRSVPVYPAPAGAAPVVPLDTETIPQTTDPGETIPGGAPVPPQPNEARRTLLGDGLLARILNGSQRPDRTPPRTLAHDVAFDLPSEPAAVCEVAAVAEQPSPIAVSETTAIAERPSPAPRRSPVAKHRKQSLTASADNSISQAVEALPQPALANDTAERRGRDTRVADNHAPSSEMISLLSPLPEAERVRSGQRQSASPAAERHLPQSLHDVRGDAAPLKPTKRGAPTDEHAAPPAVDANRRRMAAAKHRPSAKSKVAAIRFLSESTTETAIPIAAGEPPATSGILAQD